jgi:hypothetical protein
MGTTLFFVESWTLKSMTQLVRPMSTRLILMLLDVRAVLVEVWQTQPAS